MEAPLYGLILCGGKSTRMGTDKGLISYRDKPQRHYMYDLVRPYCDTVYYSAREDQLPSFGDSTEVIVDRNQYSGPFNGILSAHARYPHAAWLVLACDLPLLTKDGMAYIVNKRNINRIATCYSSKGLASIEPLMAIWEPKGLQAAKQFLQTFENAGPRQFLLNSDVQLVQPQSEEQLFNANSRKEYEWAKERIE